jgi:3-oxoacyl-[acyl-carrier protein] reductase
MKRVLVTGASKGIGKAIALELGSQGWEVAIHYSSDHAGAEDCLAQLGSQSSGAYRADLSNLETAKRLFEQVEAQGELYAVVNNAGIYQQQSFIDCDETDFDSLLNQMLAINFLAPLYIIRAAAKQFAERRTGKILNVASRVGFKGEAGAAIYAASKAALINLTRSLAVELAPQSVGVFGIAPGWVETAMAREGMDTRLPDIIATLPLGRMASPEDCATAASFLLSEPAAYLSGQVIDINGASYFH